MASNYIQNLSSTYQQSPSLQNQFATEQDYLDLFDDNQVTPAMAQAYVPVDDDTSGIKSITNTTTPIIRDGDGGDGPPSDPPGATTGFSSQGAPYGNAKGGMHNYEDEDDDGLGYKDALGLAIGGPFGYVTGKIGRYAFNKVKNAIKQNRAKKAAEEKAAIDKNKAEVAAIQARIDKEYTEGGGGNFGKDPTGSKERGHNMHGDGKAAMGGLMGYGGKSGTPRSIRSYFKGGIVSLRNGGAPMYSEEDFPVLLDPKRQDGSKPSLYDYDGQYDNYDDEVIEIPMSGKMKKPKKKKKKKTKSYFNGGLVSIRGR